MHGPDTPPAAAPSGAHAVVKSPVMPTPPLARADGFVPPSVPVLYESLITSPHSSVDTHPGMVAPGSTYDVGCGE